MPTEIAVIGFAVDGSAPRPWCGIPAAATRFDQTAAFRGRDVWPVAGAVTAAGAAAEDRLGRAGDAGRISIRKMDRHALWPRDNPQPDIHPARGWTLQATRLPRRAASHGSH